MSDLSVNSVKGDTYKQPEISSNKSDDSINISFKNNTEEMDLTPAQIAGLEKSTLAKDSEWIKSLQKISSDREAVSEMLKDYADKNGTELLDDIMASNNFSDKEKKELMKSVMGDFYKMKEPFKEIKGSKIQNEYYTGDEFDLKYSGQIINITNKTTGEKVRLDVDKILDGNSKDAVRFMKKLDKNNIPPEVLFDFAKECKSASFFQRQAFGTFFKDNGKTTKLRAGGMIEPETDAMQFKGHMKSLVHELGHLIDESATGFATWEDEFVDIFEDEMNTYIDKGNKTFEQSINYFFPGRAAKKYAIESPEEFFASSYNLMMTGKDKSQEVILEHFPKSFAAAKTILEQRRKLSDSERKSSEKQ